MTFVRREINLAFVLGEGSFGEGDSNAVEITGLRTSAQITRAGGVSMSSLNLRVWGMPLDVMQKLSVLNILALQQYRRNVVTVTAGDAENGFGVVFSGEIKEAWVDAENSPDVCFTLTAFEGMTDKVRPVAPNSFKGSASVDVLMGSIARQMQPPRTFENNGVDVTLDNVYLPGTLDAQVRKIADAAQCVVYMDSAVLAIWPVGSARGGAILELSAANGLVGYPQFSQTGVSLTVLYTPSLSYGQKIRLRSTLGSPANGDWIVANVTHNLDSETPGGQWFTYVECGRDGFPTPVIG
jgi:hypothetical protein